MKVAAFFALIGWLIGGVISMHLTVTYQIPFPESAGLTLIIAGLSGILLGYIASRFVSGK